MAIMYDVPIVIHTRESFDETFEVLERKKHPKLRGIFHCFSGNLEQAKRAIDLNFLLGIGGVVTFKNGKIDQFLHEIPLEKIFLETDDADFDIAELYQKAAEIKEIPVEKLQEQISKNLEILNKFAPCFNKKELILKSKYDVLGYEKLPVSS